MKQRKSTPFFAVSFPLTKRSVSFVVKATLHFALALFKIRLNYVSNAVKTISKSNKIERFYCMYIPWTRTLTMLVNSLADIGATTSLQSIVSPFALQTEFLQQRFHQGQERQRFYELNLYFWGKVWTKRASELSFTSCQGDDTNRILNERKNYLQCKSNILSKGIQVKNDGYFRRAKRTVTCK